MVHGMRDDGAACARHLADQVAVIPRQGQSRGYGQGERQAPGNVHLEQRPRRGHSLVAVEPHRDRSRVSGRHFGKIWEARQVVRTIVAKEALDHAPLQAVHGSDGTVVPESRGGLGLMESGVGA